MKTNYFYYLNMTFLKKRQISKVKKDNLYLYNDDYIPLHVEVKKIFVKT